MGNASSYLSFHSETMLEQFLCCKALGKTAAGQRGSDTLDPHWKPLGLAGGSYRFID